MTSRNLTIDHRHVEGVPPWSYLEQMFTFRPSLRVLKEERIPCTSRLVTPNEHVSRLQAHNSVPVTDDHIHRAMLERALLLVHELQSDLATHVSQVHRLDAELKFIQQQFPEARRAYSRHLEVHVRMHAHEVRRAN